MYISRLEAEFNANSVGLLPHHFDIQYLCYDRQIEGLNLHDGAHVRELDITAFDKHSAVGDVSDSTDAGAEGGMLDLDTTGHGDSWMDALIYSAGHKKLWEFVAVWKLYRESLLET